MDNDNISNQNDASQGRSWWRIGDIWMVDGSRLFQECCKNTPKNRIIRIYWTIRFQA